MAAVDWFAQAEAAEQVAVPRRPARRRAAPRPAGRRPARPVRSRRKLTQRRVRGHIVWMILFALLLFGVVAVNVAVLRAHVAVSKLDEQLAQLQARNQALASELSAASSAPRIETAAHRLGLVQAPGANTSYLDLTAGSG
jgi:cell division protein FtsL